MSQGEYTEDSDVKGNQEIQGLVAALVADRYLGSLCSHFPSSEQKNDNKNHSESKWKISASWYGIHSYA